MPVELRSNITTTAPLRLVLALKLFETYTFGTIIENPNTP